MEMFLLNWQMKKLVMDKDIEEIKKLFKLNRSLDQDIKDYFIEFDLLLTLLRSSLNQGICLDQKQAIKIFNSMSNILTLGKRLSFQNANLSFYKYSISQLFASTEATLNNKRAFYISLKEEKENLEQFIRRCWS